MGWGCWGGVGGIGIEVTILIRSEILDQISFRYLSLPLLTGEQILHLGMPIVIVI